MRPRRLPEHASATGLTVARRVRVRAEELLTDYRTVCSELYARTVSSGPAERREARMRRVVVVRENVESDGEHREVLAV